LSNLLNAIRQIRKRHVDAQLALLLSQFADTSLVESVDETIRLLFSQKVVDALYLNLKNKRSISREEIPGKLHVLHVVLEEYFGLSACTLGRAIARKFYSKLGLEFQTRNGFQLTDYVDEAKKKLRLSFMAGNVRLSAKL